MQPFYRIIHVQLGTQKGHERANRGLHVGIVAQQNIGQPGETSAHKKVRW